MLELKVNYKFTYPYQQYYILDLYDIRTYIIYIIINRY